MKKCLLIFLIFIFTFSQKSFSQCAPVSCLSSLPPYGGICDTILIDGRVNVAYYDFESFHITTACFDAGLISPPNAGTGITIRTVKN